MSFGLNPVTIKRGEYIKANDIQYIKRRHIEPTPITVSSPRLCDSMMQRTPILTSKQLKEKYSYRNQRRPEDEKMKHCGIKQLRRNSRSFVEDIRAEVLSCHQPQLLIEQQKGMSSPSDKNQPKIQQSDKLIDYLKGIVNHQHIYARQIHGNAYSEYLNPIIHMTNIVKIIEKINYAKVDVTNIIKTAYLTQEGKNMLSEYWQLKYGCVGPTREQQRQYDELEDSIRKAQKQLQALQQTIQDKKKDEKHEKLRDDVKKKCLQYQTQRDRLSEQCRQLKKKSDQIKAVIDRDGVKLAENRSLAQALKDKEALCDKLQKENEQLKKKINKDESFVKSVNAQFDALSQGVRNKEKQIADLKKQMEYKTQQVREAKTKALIATTERDNKTKQLKAQNKRISQELKQKQLEINKYEKAKEQWQKTQSELHDKLSNAKEEVKSLQLKIGNLTREKINLQEGMRRASSMSTDKESVINGILQEQKRKQETIDVLQKENTVLNEQIKKKQRQLRDASEKIEKLHAAFEKLVVQHKALEEKVFAKDRIIDNLTQNQTVFQDRFNVLQMQYSDLSQKSTALIQQRDCLQNKLQIVQIEQKARSDSIQTELKHKQEQLVSIAKTKSQLEHKIGKLEEQINLLSEQNKEHTKAVQGKDQVIKDLQIKQEKGRRQLQTLMKQHLEEREALRKQKEELTVSVKQYQTQNQRALQDKLNALQIQYSDLNQQIIDMAHQRDSLQEKLQKVYTEQKTRSASIQTELKNKQKQLDSTAEAKSQLQQKIDKLEEQIKALNEQKEKQIKTIQQKDELVKALQVRQEENQQRLKSFKKQHQEVEHTLKKQIEELKFSVKEYQTKMKKSNQAVLALQSKHKQQLKDINNEAQTHLRKKIAEFQGEIDKLATQNKQFKNQNDELKSQNYQLEEQLRKANDERGEIIRGEQLHIAQTKEQGVECHNNEELEKALEKIKRLQNEIQEKQEYTNEMRTIIDEERSQMDTLRSLIKESNEQEQPAQPTEEDIKRQPRQGKDLSKKLQQKQNQLNDLIEGTQQLNINYNELLQDYQKLEKEHNQLKQEHKKLQQQVNQSEYLRISNDQLKQTNINLEKIRKQLVQALSRTQQKYIEQLAKVKHFQGIQEENVYLRELNQKLSKQVDQLNVSGSIIREVEEYNNQQGERSSSLILKSVVSNPDLNGMEEEQQMPQIISIEQNTFDEVVDLLEVEQKQSSKMGCKKCQVLERKIKLVHQLLDPQLFE